jgi:hypothetical protein
VTGNVFWYYVSSASKMMQMRANTLGEQLSPLASLIQYAERSFDVDELEFSLEYTPISK